jgi:hypothetical protein
MNKPITIGDKDNAEAKNMAFSTMKCADINKSAKENKQRDIFLTNCFLDTLSIVS